MNGPRRTVWRKTRGAVILALGLGVALLFGGCKLPWLTNLPAIPTGVTASDGTFADKVRILWQAVEGAQKYLVYRAPSEEGVYAKIGETTSISYNDASVTPNVVYWYKVKACNSAGCSDYSASDSGYAQSTVAGAPSTPTGVTASDGTYTDRIRVTWNPVPGATQYEVHRDTAADGIFPLRATVTGNTFDDTDVIPGQTYWYRIRACNVAGCSLLSEADSGYAEAVVPGIPGNVTASDGTYDDRVRVNWNTVAGAARYEIYRALSETGTYTKLADDTSPPYDDTTVTVGTTYWYKVKACNAAGCSGLSDADSGYAQTGGGGGGGGGGEEPTSPARPTGVTATDGSDDYPDSIYITWSEVDDADTYQIYRSETEGGDYTQIAETTETEYEDVDGDTSPVIPCRTYWYRVRACNEAGCSDLSDPESGYCGTPVVGVPHVTASDGLHAEQIDLQWEEIAGATSYTIYRSESYTGPYDEIDTVNEAADDDEDTDVEYVDTTFSTAGDPHYVPDYWEKTFWYKVKACGPAGTDCGCGGLSAPESGYVTPEPGQPQNVTATAGGGNITITWDAVPRATRYEVYRATAEDGPYTLIADADGNDANTTCTDDTGISGTTYWYKVKACNLAGCGPLSEADSAVAP